MELALHGSVPDTGGERVDLSSWEVFRLGATGAGATLTEIAGACGVPLEDFLWANRDLQPLRGAKGNCRLTECSEVLMPVQYGAAFGEALKQVDEVDDEADEEEEKEEGSDAELDLFLHEHEHEHEYKHEHEQGAAEEGVNAEWRRHRGFDLEQEHEQTCARGDHAAQGTARLLRRSARAPGG